MQDYISSRRKFRIEPFMDCPIYGRLIFEGDKGSVKIYFEGEEIDECMIDNYNRKLIDSIIQQATVICDISNRCLWSY